MALAPDTRFCNCCSPAVAPAPAHVWNRPGLSQVGYRIGTFATFRQGMLGEIHRHPGLAALLTRESDDHAITLIELVAALGDVLTFYSERIANEMYLGQALHKASVEQLVALLGYVPRPALSATGALSFTIEEGRATRLRKGLKVMSVPGPDETAQVFETLAELHGVGRLSAVPAFAPPERINALGEGRARAPVLADAGVVAGDRMVLFGVDSIEEKSVESLATSPAGAYLGWAPPVQHGNFHPDHVRAAKLLRRLRFFGSNAPASVNVYDSAQSIPPQLRWGSVEIDASFGSGVTDYPMDRTLDDLKPGAHLLLDAGAGAEPRLRTARVTAVEDAPTTLGPSSPTMPPPLSDTVTHVEVRQTVIGRPTVFALPDGSPAVLVRSGGGHPSVVLAGAPTPGQLLVLDDPVFFASSDVVGLSLPNRIDVLVRDTARRLRQRVYAGAVSPWIDHGGELTSAPVPVALAGGQARVFVRGPGGGLFVYDTTTGAAASPLALGGILASPPAAVSPDGVGIAIFARGIDDALWWRWFDGLAWQGWERIGGRIDGTPAAAATGAGRIDVFARGLEGGVRHFRQTVDGWAPDRDLGGDAAGDPAAVGGTPDWAAVAVRTSEGRLSFRSRIGETWSDWIDQGGSIGSDPTMAIGAAGVHVAARHTDGTVVTTRLALQLPPWVRHGQGFGAVPDRRRTRIYEMSGDDIRFRDHDYPDRVSGAGLALRIEPGENAADPEGLGALKKGRAIILAGGGRMHRAEITQAFAFPSSPGARPDHLAIGISPPLAGAEGPLTLHGNIAEASHGETQREDLLGSGDAARPFQSFPVPPGLISYLPDTAGVRPVPQVELRVDNLLWQEVPHLYGRGPREHVFTLRIPAEGDPVVTGGNGVSAGARFPTGAANVRMLRRVGAGLSGNVRAGQLSIALEKPVGLREVANPLPTAGGAPGETGDEARTAAPDTMRTFGRIVSLRDFAALATASGLAARAHVTWVWDRMQRTAHLTVAGHGGAPLAPETLAVLYAQLTASRDPNRPLMLANMVRVPIVIAAKLLIDTAYVAAAVQDSAREALATAFAFEEREIGRPVHLSDAYAVVMGVAGVRAADIDLLHLRDHADLSAVERTVRSVTVDPAQTHIRIYPARPTPDDPAKIDRYQSSAYLPGSPPAVLPAEQAYLADPATDVTLTAVESF